MAQSEMVGVKSPLDALQDALVAFLKELDEDEQGGKIGELTELRDSVRDGQDPVGLQLEGWSRHLEIAGHPSYVGKAASAASLASSHLGVAFENDGMCRPVLANMGGHNALESLAEAKAWHSIAKGERAPEDFEAIRDSFKEELAREIGVVL